MMRRHSTKIRANFLVPSEPSQTASDNIGKFRRRFSRDAKIVANAVDHGERRDQSVLLSKLGIKLFKLNGQTRRRVNPTHKILYAGLWEVTDARRNLRSVVRMAAAPASLTYAFHLRIFG